LGSYLVFGGQVGDFFYEPTNSLEFFDLGIKYLKFLMTVATSQWNSVSTTGPLPVARYGHTLNIIGSKMYAFGGSQAAKNRKDKYLNDIASIDIRTLKSGDQKWNLIQANRRPASRSRHVCVSMNDKLIM
jgi:N-acetylneuraminic acid mutarotase